MTSNENADSPDEGGSTTRKEPGDRPDREPKTKEKDHTVDRAPLSADTKNLDKAVGDKDRANLATVKESLDDRSARATGTDGISSGINGNPDRPLVTDTGAKEVDPIPAQPTERASNSLWKDLVDFIGGVGDFSRNRDAMIQKNTVGWDKYYHCMANCEATARGPGGNMSAELLSAGRELTDAMRHMLPKDSLGIGKGLTPQESWRDIREDLAVNREGRLGALRGDRCADVCRIDRLRGLK